MTAAPSLHQRILGELQAKILSGVWAPGHRLPVEHELSAQYGCSRMTVNKALAHLAGAGLIERRRRAGSFVSRPRSQSAVLDIQEIGAEVAAMGLAYRFELMSLSQRRSLGADRERLDVARGTRILDIGCRHFAGDQPFCQEERLINLAGVPPADATDFTTVPPGAWLRRHVPWSRAEHRIAADGASSIVAAALRIAPGAPCLVIERRTWGAGEEPITAARLTYPAEAHRLVARFTPAAVGRSASVDPEPA